MNRKQIFLLSLLALVTLSLAFASTYLWQSHQIHVDSQVLTYKAQRDSAVKEAAQLENTYKAQATADQTALASLQSSKVKLCAQIKTAKLTNPVCP